MTKENGYTLEEHEYPRRGRRVANLIGHAERDKDGWLWYSQHSKSPDDEEARMERKKQSNRNHDHGINVIKKESDMERR